MDSKKPEPECYGDLVIWNEIIEYAHKNNKNIIFITDDKKEDWWGKKIEGKTTGPSHELIKEFYDKTSMLFYMYTSDKFIELISDRFNIKDTEELKDESKELAIINFKELVDASFANKRKNYIKYYTNNKYNNLSHDYLHNINKPFLSSNELFKRWNKINNDLNNESEVFIRKYRLILLNKDVCLIPYMENFKIEFKRAVEKGYIDGYEIVSDNEHEIIVIVLNEKSIIWHKQFGNNLKNIHGLSELVSSENPHMMFKWVKVPT